MEGGAVISSSTSEEKVKNAGNGGEPGMGTNPGGVNAPTYQTGSDTVSEYSNIHEEINYGYDEMLSEHEKAAGKMIPEESGLALTLWYGRRVTDDSRLSDEFINDVRLALSTPQEYRCETYPSAGSGSRQWKRSKKLQRI